jgi:hypothetical protein
MLTTETVNHLESTINLVCDQIQEKIKKGGGVEGFITLPDLLNSLSNLVNASKN